MFEQWLASQDPQRVANDISTSTKWLVDEFTAAAISKKLGDNDLLCPVSVLSEFEKSIGKGSRVVIFKGRGHAFAHRPGSLEEDADAEQAFTLMRNWLHDDLVVNS
ncbi:hypothetical protein CRYUN_Cryun27aG0011400 [Craigia yunnanensis]